MKQPTTTPTLPVPVGPPPAIASKNAKLLEVLEQWKREDATSDPELIRAAERELDEFIKAMNKNRVASGERILFP